MKDNSFCDNKCTNCLGFKMCRKSFKKETIYYDSKKESGNIFFILAKVKTALRKQHRANDFNECWQSVQNCGSYQDALDAISDYVILVDLSRQ